METVRGGDRRHGRKHGGDRHSMTTSRAARRGQADGTAEASRNRLDRSPLELSEPTVKKSADDFDWGDERSVIITDRVQAAIAVYPNEAGDLVIRQQAHYLVDREDLVIVIGAEHIQAFIEQVHIIAGIPHHVEPPAPGGPTSGYEKYIRHPGWTDPSIPFPPAPKRRDTPDLSISPSSRRDATAAERKRRQRQRDRERKQSKTLEGTHQQPPIGGGRGIQPD